MTSSTHALCDGAHTQKPSSSGLGTLPQALVGGLLGAQGAAGERSPAEQPR